VKIEFPFAREKLSPLALNLSGASKKKKHLVESVNRVLPTANKPNQLVRKSGKKNQQTSALFN